MLEAKVRQETTIDMKGTLGEKWHNGGWFGVSGGEISDVSNTTQVSQPLFPCLLTLFTKGCGDGRVTALSGKDVLPQNMALFWRDCRSQG